MDVPADRDQMAALHLKLIDEMDPLRRAGIHLELASLAVRAGQFQQAARHFREALLLDATLDAARKGLARLGATERPVAPAEGGLRGWIGRLRRR
jgi:Flp pilus assembly protein TadD